MMGYLKKVILLGNGTITRAWVVAAYKLCNFLYALYKKNGIKYVVKYLKVTQVTLSQTLGGLKHAGPKLLGAGVAMTHSGLPRFIPIEHRKMIREGNLAYIRIWMSLLSVYRVFDYTGDYKVDTIIQPGSMSDSMFEVCVGFVPSFMKMLQDFGIKPTFVGTIIGKPYKLFRDLSGRIFPILKSSPTSSGTMRVLGTSLVSTHPALILRAAAALWRNEPMMIAWVTIAKSFKSTRLLDLAIKTMQLADKYFVGSPTGPLGKVGFKVEAAGKVRVFAMVECWTAWLLQPLHKALFQLLSRIPQDGTHEQHKPVKQLIGECQKLGLKDLYSYDLTAATDRLPIAIQEVILSKFLGKKCARAWSELLVGREYAVPKVPGRRLPKSVKYAVGQPMGAYSSWAMLALTHHFLVQLAAYRAGTGVATWFKLYAVLGDDIVIGDPAVAKSYLEVLSFMGMPVNLTKSVVSNNLSCEFAKRYYFKGEDISMLSFKELVVALVDFQTMQELMRKVHSYMPVTPALVMALKGVGYIGRSRWNMQISSMSIARQKFLLALTMPGSIFGVSSYSIWLSQVSFHNSPRVWIDPKSLIGIFAMVEKLRLSLVQKTDKIRHPWNFEVILKALSVLTDGPTNPVIGKMERLIVMVLNEFQSDFNDRYVTMLHAIDERWDEFRTYFSDLTQYLILKDIIAGPILDRLINIMECFEDALSMVADPTMDRPKEKEYLYDTKLLREAMEVRKLLKYTSSPEARVSGSVTRIRKAKPKLSWKQRFIKFLIEVAKDERNIGRV